MWSRVGRPGPHSHRALQLIQQVRNTDMWAGHPGTVQRGSSRSTGKRRQTRSLLPGHTFIHSTNVHSRPVIARHSVRC